jgi:hypothetical protein
MINQDILAYVILGIFYALVIIPLSGSLLTTGLGSGYLNDWKFGAKAHVSIILFAAVACSFLWALAKAGWL